MAQNRNFIVKTVSAPPEWWALVDAAREASGIDSRANFIRFGMEDFIERKFNEVANAHAKKQLENNHDNDS